MGTALVTERVLSMHEILGLTPVPPLNQSISHSINYLLRLEIKKGPENILEHSARPPLALPSAGEAECLQLFLDTG